MKIGIDINPTLDKVTGKGIFIKNVLEVLSDIDRKNEYFLFGTEHHNLDLGENFKFVEIPGELGLQWDLKVLRRSILSKRVDVFLSMKSIFSPIIVPRSILGVHDLGVFKHPEFYSDAVVKKYRQWLPVALRRAKIVITPSAATKSQIVHSLKIPSKKIVKIPLAVPSWVRSSVEEEDFDRVKDKYNLPEQYFLFAGTLEPRKNIKTLIEAFKEFKTRDRKKYKLIIVGKKGYEYEDLFKYVIDNEMSQDVIFTGHIPENDMKPMYLNARAFVFPSLLEGFGLTPLEAMACGVPVLCSKKGAIGEVVGDVCLEIKPQDKNSIAEAMKKIKLDNKLRGKLVTKGQRRAKQFKWHKSAKKLLKVFEEVGSRKK